MALWTGTQIIYTARKLLVMTSNKKAPLPGLLFGNGIVEFELSMPHSAPKYPFKNQKGKGRSVLLKMPMYINKMNYMYICLSFKGTLRFQKAPF